MKKILTLTLLLGTTMSARTQNNVHALSNKDSFDELVRDVVILLMIYMVTNFILTMIKLFLDDRLKRKIVETGTPEGVVAQLIPNDKTENKNGIKWFCILIAIAVGLGVIGSYQPSDIYSLMIMAFCLAIGFISYFFLTSRLGK